MCSKAAKPVILGQSTTDSSHVARAFDLRKSVGICDPVFAVTARHVLDMNRAVGREQGQCGLEAISPYAY